MRSIKILFCFLLILFVLSPLGYSAEAKRRNEVSLLEIVSQPKKYKNKRVNLTGEFYSFSNLSLDYEKAMKSSKEYFGIVLSRPDIKEIPLVELKLALSLKKFKENEDLAAINHGDIIHIYGEVYAVALGEPWLEVKSIEVEHKAKKDDEIEVI